MEFDLAVLLLEVSEHFGNDLNVALVNHAGTDEAEVDVLVATVKRKVSDRIVCVALGCVFVVYVGVRDHRLDNEVEVDHKFSEVLGVRVGSESWLFADRISAMRLLALSIKPWRMVMIIHALVDHYLDTTSCYF